MRRVRAVYFAVGVAGVILTMALAGCGRPCVQEFVTEGECPAGFGKVEDVTGIRSTPCARVCQSDEDCGRCREFDLRGACEPGSGRWTCNLETGLCDPSCRALSTF